MRPLVYIAAPYAAPTPEGRAWNVRRACALSLLAQRMGYAPICVHPGIAAGAYGDDAVPEDRAAGLDVDVALVSRCAMLLAIVGEHGAMSAGVTAEVLAAESAGVWAVKETWAGWRPMFAKAGLSALWAELAGVPHA